MSKPKQKADPGVLRLPNDPTETDQQSKGRAALLPTVNAASVIQAYQSNVMGADVDLTAMVDGLRDTIKEVKGGDLSRLEAMLISQATALQTLFTSLARRATHQEQLRQYEAYTVLALKAQAQSRATISALVDLKFPRQATFVKQANIAHGPQQVNNGPAPAGTRAHAHAREKKGDDPELLERRDGEVLEARFSREASTTEREDSGKLG